MSYERPQKRKRLTLRKGITTLRTKTITVMRSNKGIRSYISSIKVLKIYKKLSPQIDEGEYRSVVTPKDD